ncbi:MAG TPA: hypothetical protein VF894_06815 [Anaeromyxobacter sp.]
MTTAELPALRHLPRLHFGLAAVVLLATFAIAVPVYAGWQALTHPELYADGLTGEVIPPPSSGGWIFLLGGLAAVALGAALSVALAVAGRAIARRRSHAFCLATSFAASFFFPLGTLLGFHTIHVLCDPGARAAFGLPPPRGRPPAA